MPEKYHLRRAEKAIESKDEMIGIIDSCPYLTFAMTSEVGPYLVTVNHALDRERTCVYFHCAGEGRKIDCIKSNPEIWGQVIEDLGYVEKECDWGYRSVHFWGEAEFVSDTDEKRHALELLIDKLEPDAETTKKEQITQKSLAEVRIVRISLQGFTGKQRLPKKG